MVTPIEEIPNNENLLRESGIIHLGLEFCPDIDCNPETGEYYICGTNAIRFIDRYNNKKIPLQNRFKDYIENKDIQGCLSDLGLDSERFWYLLLFVYDYCVGTCFDNIKTKEGVGSIIEKFVELIKKGINYSYRKPQHSVYTLKEISFNEPVELTLKVGKKKIHITDNETIGIIGMACEAMYTDIKDANIFKGSICLNEPDEYSDTAMAYLFCKMLRYFFDSTDHIKERRAVSANISNKEKELLSYLLYFTKVSRNENLLNPFANEYNTVKGLMNPKKPPVFSSMNNYY